MNISEQDFKYMVECATADLIRMLIERENYDMKSAVDVVYQSKTYSALTRPQTGLYYQSSGYLFDYLIEEVRAHA